MKLTAFYDQNGPASTNFYHLLKVYDSKMVFSWTESIGVLEGLDSVHIVHGSPTISSVARHPLKWSEYIEILRSFGTFSRYTTPEWLPSQINELKVFGWFELTYFYEGHALVAICHRILQ